MNSEVNAPGSPQLASISEIVGCTVRVSFLVPLKLNRYTSSLLSDQVYQLLIHAFSVLMFPVQTLGIISLISHLGQFD